MAKRISPIRHGVPSGVRAHRRRGEDPCAECRLAWNEAARERQSRMRARDRAAGKKRTRTTCGLECVRCGAAFMAESRAQRFCSHRCHMYDASQRSRATALVPFIPTVKDAPPTPVTVVTTPKWWAVIVNGPCSWCGETFTSPCGTSRYCSAACAKAVGRASRGGRFLISPRRRLTLYERDGWICQLCYEPIDRGAHYLDDWAPSLDHIECQSWMLVPDHSDENLRCVHRWCNSVRGDGTYHADFFEEARLVSA